MKVKMKNKLPRLICTPGMVKKDYRSLQFGEIVDLDIVVASELIEAGYLEKVVSKKKLIDGGEE